MQFTLTDVEEFLLMTKFNNLVIANSTFSFWAAATIKKINKNSIIIAPKNWYFNELDNQVWQNNLLKLKIQIVN